MQLRQAHEKEMKSCLKTSVKERRRVGEYDAPNEESVKVINSLPEVRLSKKKKQKKLAYVCKAEVQESKRDASQEPCIKFSE